MEFLAADAGRSRVFLIRLPKDFQGNGHTVLLVNPSGTRVKGLSDAQVGGAAQRGVDKGLIFKPRLIPKRAVMEATPELSRCADGANSHLNCGKVQIPCRT